MHSEFERSGGMVEVYSKEFDKVLFSYTEHHLISRDNFLKDSNAYNNLLQLQKDVTALSVELIKAVTTCKADITSEFNQTNKIDFPDVGTAFSKDLKNFFIDKDYLTKKLLPSNANYAKIFEKMVDRMDNYKKQNPEYFI